MRLILALLLPLALFLSSCGAGEDPITTGTGILQPTNPTGPTVTANPDDDPDDEAGVYPEASRVPSLEGTDPRNPIDEGTYFGNGICQGGNCACSAIVGSASISCPNSEAWMVADNEQNLLISVRVQLAAAGLNDTPTNSNTVKLRVPENIHPDFDGSSAERTLTTCNPNGALNQAISDDYNFKSSVTTGSPLPLQVLDNMPCERRVILRDNFNQSTPATVIAKFRTRKSNGSVGPYITLVWYFTRKTLNVAVNAPNNLPANQNIPFNLTSASVDQNTLGRGARTLAGLTYLCANNATSPSNCVRGPYADKLAIWTWWNSGEDKYYMRFHGTGQNTTDKLNYLKEDKGYIIPTLVTQSPAGVSCTVNFVCRSPFGGDGSCGVEFTPNGNLTARPEEVTMKFKKNGTTPKGFMRMDVAYGPRIKVRPRKMHNKVKHQIYQDLKCSDGSMTRSLLATYDMKIN